MRIQLWSYNYAPEPQGIAPLSAMLAEALIARGHDVLVVAAHPHYPEPAWGVRLRPYRETRNGVPVLRLPLWPGRSSGLARVRQELTFTASQSLVAPLLPDADVMIAVTPSFPALAVAMAVSKARRIPWVMWLQDIVTDGAATTGQLSEGPALKAARRFERATYESASRIVVISEEFRRNLERKGVAAEKIVRVFNPSSRQPKKPNDVRANATAPRPSVLVMGNIGHSQGLDKVVDAWQRNAALTARGARLVIAGGGVAAEEVRSRIRLTNVEMTGVLYDDELTPVLESAVIGLVSQRPDVAEFNLPSKLMNYMAYGLPIIASVRAGSETARIVTESGAGWAVDAAVADDFAQRAAALLEDVPALEAASQAAYLFALENFTPEGIATHFEAVLTEATSGYATSRRRRRYPKPSASPVTDRPSEYRDRKVSS
jgi:colanic acid biosynthesis glycosyl transferase WcaI